MASSLLSPTSPLPPDSILETFFGNMFSFLLVWRPVPPNNSILVSVGVVAVPPGGSGGTPPPSQTFSDRILCLQSKAVDWTFPVLCGTVPLINLFLVAVGGVDGVDVPPAGRGGTAPPSQAFVVAILRAKSVECCRFVAGIGGTVPLFNC